MTEVRQNGIRPGLPTSGTGTVFVNELHTGEWISSWQDDEAHVLDGPSGEQEEVAAWALAQPAARRLVFDREGQQRHV